MATKKRRSGAKKSAAKKAAAPRAPFEPIAPGTSKGAAETSAAASAPKGPTRPLMPDGKRPHDPVTYGALIELGLIAHQELGTDG